MANVTGVLQFSPEVVHNCGGLWTVEAKGHRMKWHPYIGKVVLRQPAQEPLRSRPINGDDLSQIRTGAERKGSD